MKLKQDKKATVLTSSFPALSSRSPLPSLLSGFTHHHSFTFKCLLTFTFSSRNKQNTNIKLNLTIQHLPVVISLSKLQQLSIKEENLPSPLWNSENHSNFCLLKLISVQCSKIPLLWKWLKSIVSGICNIFFYFLWFKGGLSQKSPSSWHYQIHNCK